MNLPMAQQLSPKKSKKKVGDFMIDYDKKLGEGAFGKVYEAINQKTKEVVAVKQIERSKIHNQYLFTALKREVRIMNSLNSPNIIKLIDYIESPNNYYIVEEFANNGNLSNMIKKNGPFKEQFAIPIMWQILNGFKQLAKNGIVHRDIKPQNILIKQNTFKIADFGLSRQINDLFKMTSGIGTIVYMAPQIFSAETKKDSPKYTFKCDIWSFGVICYQLIVGSVPWKNLQPSNQKQLIYQKIKSEIQHGIQYPPNLLISDNYKNLVKGCLQFEEKDRLDWNQVFHHPLFGQNIKEIQQLNIPPLSYTLTNVRLKVHSKNINLQKLMEKMPEEFSKQQNLALLQCIDSDVDSEDTQQLFKYLGGSDTKRILRKDLMESFSKHHINLKGEKNLQKTQLEVIIENFKKDIESRQIDIYKIFKDFQEKGIKKISKQQCKQFLKNITSSLFDDQIQELCNFFNSEQFNNISLSALNTKMCRVLQIPRIQSQKIWRQIKKMEKKKQN